MALPLQNKSPDSTTRHGIMIRRRISVLLLLFNFVFLFFFFSHSVLLAVFRFGLRGFDTYRRVNARRQQLFGAQGKDNLFSRDETIIITRVVAYSETKLAPHLLRRYVDSARVYCAKIINYETRVR